MCFWLASIDFWPRDNFWSTQDANFALFWLGRGLAVTAHRCCVIVKYFTLPTTHNQKPDPPSFCFDALERAEDEDMPLVAFRGPKKGSKFTLFGNPVPR